MSILDTARNLRKNQTKEEKIMWNLLRNRQLTGLKFRRQHPVSRFIADFYCHKIKLVIELDGGYHENKDVKIYDEARKDEIKRFGITVLRFKTKKY